MSLHLFHSFGNWSDLFIEPTGGGVLSQSRTCRKCGYVEQRSVAMAPKPPPPPDPPAKTEYVDEATAGRSGQIVRVRTPGGLTVTVAIYGFMAVLSAAALALLLLNL